MCKSKSNNTTKLIDGKSVLHCGDCGNEIIYFKHEIPKYNGEWICGDCAREHYTYCRMCGKFSKLSELNNYHFCKSCAEKCKANPDWDSDGYFDYSKEIAD